MFLQLLRVIPLEISMNLNTKLVHKGCLSQKFDQASVYDSLDKSKEIDGSTDCFLLTNLCFFGFCGVFFLKKWK